MARGYLPQAAAQFREAVNHDPTNPYLHLQLAQALVAIRQIDEAEAAFQRAAALVDDNLMILMALAEFYAGIRQRPADAVALIEKAAKIDPNSAEVRGRLGEMYLYQDRLADAERETAAAVALLPDDARLLCNLGIILLRDNREREAETMLLRARDRNPALPPPRQWLCLLYATQDRIAESAAEFQALTRLIPQVAQALQIQVQSVRTQAMQMRCQGLTFNWPQAVPALLGGGQSGRMPQPTMPYAQGGWSPGGRPGSEWE